MPGTSFCANSRLTFKIIQCVILVPVFCWVLQLVHVADLVPSLLVPLFWKLLPKKEKNTLVSAYIWASVLRGRTGSLLNPLALAEYNTAGRKTKKHWLSKTYYQQEASTNASRQEARTNRRQAGELESCASAKVSQATNENIITARSHITKNLGVNGKIQTIVLPSSLFLTTKTEARMQDVCKTQLIQTSMHFQCSKGMALQQ